MATRSIRTSFESRYRLSEAARVDFTIERALPGRRKRVRGKHRCVRPTSTLVRRKARRCTRYKRAGGLTRNGTAGANRFAFSGRIGCKPLRPGRYACAPPPPTPPTTARGPTRAGSGSSAASTARDAHERGGWAGAVLSLSTVAPVAVERSFRVVWGTLAPAPASEPAPIAFLRWSR